jgi:hypothetical protein
VRWSAEGSGLPKASTRMQRRFTDRDQRQQRQHPDYFWRVTLSRAQPLHAVAIFLLLGFYVVIIQTDDAKDGMAAENRLWTVGAARS